MVRHSKSCARSLRSAIGALAAVVAIVTLAGCGGGGSTTPGTLKVDILSSAPYLVSGGSALIQLSGNLAAGDSVTVQLNGSNVTGAFKRVANGTQLGVVEGMINGNNTIVAQGFGGVSDSLTLTNYPITGPMTSGPLLTPYICQTATFTLPDGTKFGAATDANCSAPTNIQYVYMPTGGTAFKALPSLTTLPADLSKTTTTLGTAVNFIVRVETATVDRGIYQSFFLYDPTTETGLSPANPPKGWNKRLIGQHGSGCTGGWYIQGARKASTFSPATTSCVWAKATRCSSIRSIIRRTAAISYWRVKPR